MSSTSWCNFVRFGTNTFRIARFASRLCKYSHFCFPSNKITSQSSIQSSGTSYKSSETTTEDGSQIQIHIFTNWLQLRRWLRISWHHTSTVSNFLYSYCNNNHNLCHRFFPKWIVKLFLYKIPIMHAPPYTCSPLFVWTCWLCGTNRCPLGWNYNATLEKCYLFVSDRQTWTESNDHCGHLLYNASLTSIESDDEKNHILSIIPQAYAFAWVGGKKVRGTWK